MGVEKDCAVINWVREAVYRGLRKKKGGATRGKTGWQNKTEEPTEGGGVQWRTQKLIRAYRVGRVRNYSARLIPFPGHRFALSPSYTCGSVQRAPIKVRSSRKNRAWRPLASPVIREARRDECRI